MMDELDRRSDSIPSSIATAKNSYESEGHLFKGSITSSKNASLVSHASINSLDNGEGEKFELWKK